MACLADGTARNDNNVPPRLNLRSTEPHDLSQSPFNPISFNRPANSRADREAKTTVGQMIRQDTQYQNVAAQTLAAAPDLLEAVVFL